MSFLANWKTTAAGVALILGAVVDVLNQATSGNWDGTHLMADYTAVVTGVGLVVAKDANVTGGSVQQ